MGNKVVVPRNVDHYNELRNSDRVVAVVFIKDDCPACDNAKPDFILLSLKYPKVLFICINTSHPKFSILPDAKDIKTYPTFKIYKNRQLASKVVGGLVSKADENICKLSYDRGNNPC